MNKEFDFGRALDVCKNYESATGIHCMVLDSRGSLIEGAETPEICSFCRSVVKGTEMPELCRDTHLYGSYQAERFGGKYIYFCSMSLMFWTSPIFDDGLKTGTFVCGPVFAYDPEDFVMGNPLLEGKLSRESVNNLKGHLKRLPHVSPGKANSLSEILLILSKYLSMGIEDNTPSENEILGQQYKISEYIKYIDTMEGNLPEKHTYPIEKEKELLNYISRGDSKEAKEALNEILGSVFFKNKRNFDVVKSRVLELIVLLSRAALEGGADSEQIFGLNYQYINKIHSFSNVDELAFWLSKIINRFTDLVFSLKSARHMDAIYRAVNFINSNYKNKITLDDAAEAVYLSPAYFSKIFKEQTGKSFTQYLNHLRVAESKNLLRKSSIPLVDIAGMVGFEDQSYFSKVFKKFTGTTPGRYRNTRGFTKTDNQEIHT